MASYPLGKLPAEVLAALLARHPIHDPRVVVGPRVGEDAAILDLGGEHLLIVKTDPITFATDEIGWYAVNINANDIATTGGSPAWFMATLLLPEGRTDQALVESIFDQLGDACRQLSVSLIGGHTEITYGIDRPIVSGTMLGLVERKKLVLTSGVQAGDAIVVTKGVPIEAIAIIARERTPVLTHVFAQDLVARWAAFLHEPGIAIVNDARIAMQTGRIHAMHDPTEGGLATGLWEMADASGKRLVVDPNAAVLEDGRQICEAVGLDPLGAIASGALLMAVHPEDAAAVVSALEAQGIRAFQIGYAEDGPAEVLDKSQSNQPLRRPDRDEIARLFE